MVERSIRRKDIAQVTSLVIARDMFTEDFVDTLTRQDSGNKMRYWKTFEQYLMEIHAKDYHGTDDDMTDNYEKWVCELDTEEVMKYAEQAIHELLK